MNRVEAALQAIADNSGHKDFEDLCKREGPKTVIGCIKEAMVLYEQQEDKWIRMDSGQLPPRFNDLDVSEDHLVLVNGNRRIAYYSFDFKCWMIGGKEVKATHYQPLPSALPANTA